MALTIGSATKQADYATGTGTASLVFRYTVVDGDSDTDGIGVGAAALTLNGGTIADAVGNAAALGLGAHAFTVDAGYKVTGSANADTTGPTVTGVTPSGSGSASGGVFRETDVITVTVAFDEPVTVDTAGGTPQLALTIGSATKQADYATGTGTASLVFRYTVVDGDSDTDGIGVAATALTLNGGTIADAVGNAAALGLGAHAFTVDAGYKVTGSANPDTTGPTVTGVTPSGSGSASGGVFRETDVITVTVAFDEPVTVDTAGGTPQLALTIGSATKQADYATGTGTASLVFRYTVVDGDSDTDGIGVAATALTLNGGTIADAVGNAAALGLGAHAFTVDAAYKVAGSEAADTTAPTVTGVTVARTGTAAGGVFRETDVITVTVAFSEPVTVTGTPRVALTIDSTTKQANYHSGTGTTSLVFRYTVLSTDEDSNGISIAATALALNGGTIRDGARNDAALGLVTYAFTDDGRYKVDGDEQADTTAPTVAGVTLPETGTASGGAFRAGDVLEVRVAFSEPVTVTGTPQVALTIGSTTRQADYTTGSGMTLTFRYRVVRADSDTDGISIGTTALTVNGGTIRDGARNAATLGLGSHAITDDRRYRVTGSADPDASAPTVTDVTLSGNGSASEGVFREMDVITVTVEFSEAVTVTGNPQVALTIGSSTKQAAYAAADSGATSLVFRYTVASGDTDTDGISIGTAALSLNGGTIRDGARNNAALGLGSHAITDESAYKVAGSEAADTTAPTVAGVTVSQTGTAAGRVFRETDVITVTVAFSEPVTVDETGGTPQLALGIGSATRQAGYHSGSGTSSLVFRYPVLSTDEDTNGISIAAAALALNGGTIRDRARNDATLGLGAYAITDDGRYQVDGDADADTTGPTVTGVTPSGSGSASGGVFRETDVITVTVAFSEKVTVTGEPAGGAGDRVGDEAGGLRGRHRLDFLGVPLHGAVRGRGHGRDQHRGHGAGAERRGDRGPGGQRCGARPGRPHRHRRRPGGGRGRGGGHGRPDGHRGDAFRGRLGVRRGPPGRGCDHGHGGVQREGHRYREPAGGAGDRVGDEAGGLRSRHRLDFLGVPLHGAVRGRGLRRDQHRGHGAGAERRGHRGPGGQRGGARPGDPRSPSTPATR